MSGAANEKLSPEAWKIIGVVVIAPFMTQMDSTVVNVSLSAITQELHSTVAAAQWIISGYLLALALMLPINSWIVDRIGAKRLYLACFSGFTLASFLCGAAHTMNELIAARVLQGIAGGLLAPLTQLMMVRVAGRQMARVLGIASAPVLLAPLLGPILAGLILKHATWAWLFYINLPVGIVAILLAFIYIPHDETQLRQRPFDLPGFFLLSPALVSLLYGIESAAHHERAGPWAVLLGAALLAAFFHHARRRGERALVDLALFKNSTFSMAAITQFLANGIIYAGQFLIPLYLVGGCHLGMSESGWILAAMGVGMFCTYPFVGYLTDRFGIRRTASGGVLINFVGTLPFLWMAYSGYSLPLAVAGLFVRGVGQGATGIPTIAAAYASVPPERLSVATTAINIVQRLGGPILTTALAIVTSLSGVSAVNPDPHSFEIPFVVLIAVQFLIVAFTIRLPARIEP